MWSPRTSKRRSRWRCCSSRTSSGTGCAEDEAHGTERHDDLVERLGLPPVVESRGAGCADRVARVLVHPVRQTLKAQRLRDLAGPAGARAAAPAPTEERPGCRWEALDYLPPRRRSCRHERLVQPEPICDPGVVRRIGTEGRRVRRVADSAHPRGDELPLALPGKPAIRCRTARAVAGAARRPPLVRPPDATP